MKKLIAIGLLSVGLLIGCSQSQASIGLQEYKMIGIVTSNHSTFCSDCAENNIVVIYNDNGEMKRIESYYSIKVEGNILDSDLVIVGIEDNKIKYIKANKGELKEGEVVAYGNMGIYGDNLGVIATVEGNVQAYRAYDLYLNKELKSLMGATVQIGTKNNVIKIN